MAIEAILLKLFVRNTGQKVVKNMEVLVFLEKKKVRISYYGFYIFSNRYRNN